jgi:alkanesulfonate monooxygenase SsuD/methylene tetrahydromethanopterin reductase-like flavin-dependent oxidoreductase (luciferase family)
MRPDPAVVRFGVPPTARQQASPYYQPGSGSIRIVGSTNQVIEQLRDFVELSVEVFILGFADFPDPTTEVIPRFR